MERTGKQETGFEGFFKALEHQGVDVDIDRRRRFLVVLAHEASWTWESLESVAVAVFSDSAESKQKVKIAVQTLRNIEASTDESSKYIPQPDKGKSKKRTLELTTEAVAQNLIFGVLVFTLLVLFVRVTPDFQDLVSPNLNLGTQETDNSSDTKVEVNTVLSYCDHPRQKAACRRVKAETVSIEVIIAATSGLAASFSSIAFLYFLKCPLARRRLTKPWEDDGTTFTHGDVGTRRESFLTDDVCDRIAATLARDEENIVSSEIDMQKTVAATASNGGLPKLEMNPRRESMRVFVFEQRSDKLRHVLNIGRNLHENLERRGVDVFLGGIRTIDGSLIDGSGKEVSASELNELHNEIIVLVGTNEIWNDNEKLPRKFLNSHKLLLWINPQLPRQALPMRVTRDGMWQLPATSDALLFVFEVLSGLRSAQSVMIGKHSANGSGSEVAGLGDALPLAMAASIVQPISLNLLDELRSRYFKHLLPVDIRVIAESPNVRVFGEVIEFETRFLRRLKTQLHARFNAEERESIGQDILRSVLKAKPKKDKSFAQFFWEAYYLRIKYFLDPANAGQKLQRFMTTALGPNIKMHVQRGSFGITEEIIAFSNDDGMGLQYLTPILHGVRLSPLNLSRVNWFLLGLSAILSTVSTIGFVVLGI